MFKVIPLYLLNLFFNGCQTSTRVYYVLTMYFLYARHAAANNFRNHWVMLQKYKG